MSDATAHTDLTPTDLTPTVTPIQGVSSIEVIEDEDPHFSGVLDELFRILNIYNGSTDSPHNHLILSFTGTEFLHHIGLNNNLEVDIRLIRLIVQMLVSVDYLPYYDTTIVQILRTIKLNETLFMKDILSNISKANKSFNDKLLNFPLYLVKIISLSQLKRYFCIKDEPFFSGVSSAHLTPETIPPEIKREILSRLHSTILSSATTGYYANLALATGKMDERTKIIGQITDLVKNPDIEFYLKKETWQDATKLVNSIKPSKTLSNDYVNLSKLLKILASINKKTNKLLTTQQEIQEEDLEKILSFFEITAVTVNREIYYYFKLIWDKYILLIKNTLTDIKGTDLTQLFSATATQADFVRKILPVKSRDFFENATPTFQCVQTIGGSTPCMLCYICGCPLGSRAIECEHLLPIYDAVRYYALHFVNANSEFSRDEYLWSHMCCNRNKNDKKYITKNFDGSKYIFNADKEEIKTNLTAIYISCLSSSICVAVTDPCPPCPPDVAVFCPPGMRIVDCIRSKLQPSNIDKAVDDLIGRLQNIVDSLNIKWSNYAAIMVTPPPPGVTIMHNPDPPGGDPPGGSGILTLAHPSTLIYYTEEDKLHFLKFIELTQAISNFNVSSFKKALSLLDKVTTVKPIDAKSLFNDMCKRVYSTLLSEAFSYFYRVFDSITVPIEGVKLLFLLMVIYTMKQSPITAFFKSNNIKNQLFSDFFEQLYNSSPTGSKYNNDFFSLFDVFDIGKLISNYNNASETFINYLIKNSEGFNIKLKGQNITKDINLYNLSSIAKKRIKAYLKGKIEELKGDGDDEEIGIEITDEKISHYQGEIIAFLNELVSIAVKPYLYVPIETTTRVSRGQLSKQTKLYQFVQVDDEVEDDEDDEEDEEEVKGGGQKYQYGITKNKTKLQYGGTISDIEFQKFFYCSLIINFCLPSFKYFITLFGERLIHILLATNLTCDDINYMPSSLAKQMEQGLMIELDSLEFKQQFIILNIVDTTSQIIPIKITDYNLTINFEYILQLFSTFDGNFANYDGFIKNYFNHAVINQLLRAVVFSSFNIQIGKWDTNEVIDTDEKLQGLQQLITTTYFRLMLEVITTPPHKILDGDTYYNTLWFIYEFLQLFAWILFFDLLYKDNLERICKLVNDIYNNNLNEYREYGYSIIHYFETLFPTLLEDYIYYVKTFFKIMDVSHDANIKFVFTSFREFIIMFLLILINKYTEEYYSFYSKKYIVSTNAIYNIMEATDNLVVQHINMDERQPINYTYKTEVDIKDNFVLVPEIKRLTLDPTLNVIYFIARLRHHVAERKQLKAQRKQSSMVSARKFFLAHSSTSTTLGKKGKSVKAIHGKFGYGGNTKNKEQKTKNKKQRTKTKRTKNKKLTKHKKHKNNKTKHKRKYKKLTKKFKRFNKTKKNT